MCLWCIEEHLRGECTFEEVHPALVVWNGQSLCREHLNAVMIEPDDPTQRDPVGDEVILGPGVTEVEAEQQPL